MKIAALVLAAGGSSRLGQPKQLLPYEGRTLVRRAVEAAIDGGCSPVIVVVGRDRDAVAEELKDLAIEIVPNECWAHGIGSSIREGVGALPDVDAVAILACDQPHISAELLRKLITQQELTQKPMVASVYAGTVGIPALFTRARFPQLLSLGDKPGAKSLLLAQPNELATIDFPSGQIDIDTAQDYADLSGRRQKNAGRIP